MDLFQIKHDLASGKSIYELPLRVTYYARVSTDKDEQAHSLKAQIGYYEGFIRENSNWQFVPGYIDEGLSGTNVSRRDAFLRMIRDAKEGKFDFIITKEISRFSRNTLDSIRYTQELMQSGVGVFFQSDNINTLVPDAELRLTLMSSIAQDEVRKLSERVKFGFQRSIEKGVVLGNNRIWGYRKDRGRLVIDEEEAKIVREIFDLYANRGLGVRLICEELTRRGYVNSNGNPFSFTTVRNIIANPKYKGYYCGGKTSKIDYRMNGRKRHDQSEWVMYPDGENVPAIVSEELWERANRILETRSGKQRAENPAGYSSRYTYSGKIICGQHGTPYYRALYRYRSGDKEVWQCKHFAERGRAGCDSPNLYTAEVDQIVRECCRGILKEGDSIVQRLTQVYATAGAGTGAVRDIARLESEISGVLAKKDKLLELAVGGRLSDEEFEQRNGHFNDEVSRLRDQLEERKERETRSRVLAQNAGDLGRMIAGELSFDQGFSHQIADTLLERIEVCGTGENHQIEVVVHCKALPHVERYCIVRRRGKASECYRQHT